MATTYGLLVTAVVFIQQHLVLPLKLLMLLEQSVLFVLLNLALWQQVMEFFTM